MAKTFPSARFWTMNLFISAIFVIVFYQLLQLTVFRRSALEQLADKQHNLSIEVPPLRGQILDSHGKELATNLKVPSIYAIPRLMSLEEKEDKAKKLSSILGMNKEYLKDRLSRDKSFVWIKRKVSNTEEDKVRALETSSLGISEEYRRFYPQGDLLAHILGYTNVDNQGIEGIELFLDHELKGRPGRRSTKRDALGREIRAFEIVGIPSVNGHRVTLTIDHYIQYLAERAVDAAYKQWKAQAAWAIVMEAKTGRILAIVNRPNFDPNTHKSATVEARRNRAITDMYEPGSVFKIVAASGALNEGVVTPETVFNCENGNYAYGRGRVLHDVHPYGKLTFEEVIVKSSNIGTVKIAAKLGPDKLQKYITGFGFGKATGIDFPGEAPGYTRPPSQWSNTSPFNIPIGQEIMVTALQMTTALAVIANGGELVQPYLIAKVQDQAGVTIRERKPKVIRRVIRPEVAEVMRRVLVRVVEEGTGKKAHIDGIPVGGKTGTAQKVLSGGRGYSHTDFMSSFIGFAPADDPELVMAVVLDTPRGQYYGGSVAAPVFKDVIEGALLSRGHVPTNAERIQDPLNAVSPVNAAAASSASSSSSQTIQANPPKFLAPQAANT